MSPIGNPERVEALSRVPARRAGEPRRRARPRRAGPMALCAAPNCADGVLDTGCAGLPRYLSPPEKQLSAAAAAITAIAELRADTTVVTEMHP